MLFTWRVNNIDSPTRHTIVYKRGDPKMIKGCILLTLTHIYDLILTTSHLSNLKDEGNPIPRIVMARTNVTQGLLILKALSITITILVLIYCRRRGSKIKPETILVIGSIFIFFGASLWWGV